MTKGKNRLSVKDEDGSYFHPIVRKLIIDKETYEIPGNKRWQMPSMDYCKTYAKMNFDRTTATKICAFVDRHTASVERAIKQIDAHCGRNK